MTSRSALKITLTQEKFSSTIGIFGTSRRLADKQDRQTKTLWLSLSNSGLRTQMKLGEIAQSFVCSLFSISETDHAPEQGEILMDPAALPTVSSLMSTLISLT